MELHEAFVDIGREYNNNPEGWHVFIGNDNKDHPTAYFYHDTYVWVLKYASKYGQNGLAEQRQVSAGDLDRLRKDPAEFGLRIVPGMLIRAIIGQATKDAQEKKIKAEILTKKPLSEKDLDTVANITDDPHLHIGFTHYASPLAPLSSAQKRLEDRMNAELDKGYS